MKRGDGVGVGTNALIHEGSIKFIERLGVFLVERVGGDEGLAGLFEQRSAFFAISLLGALGELRRAPRQSSDGE
jgi:hypothetical protein